MADFRMVVTYRIDLTPGELRLLSRALRLLIEPGSDEARDALALQEAMMAERHKAVAQLAHETQKAVDNIAAAHGRG
jgi:hypothetical protein